MFQVECSHRRLPLKSSVTDSGHPGVISHVGASQLDFQFVNESFHTHRVGEHMRFPFVKQSEFSRRCLTSLKRFQFGGDVLEKHGMLAFKHNLAFLSGCLHDSDLVLKV